MTPERTCVCGSTDEVIHLPIYYNGSEGCYLCLSCRLLLTEVVRGLARSAETGKMQGVNIGQRMKRRNLNA